MEKSLLARKNLDECAKFQDADYLSVIYGAYLRYCAYALDPVESLLHGFLVVGCNVNNTLGATARKRFLGDGNNSTCLLLYLLNGLATLADNGSDKLGCNADLLDARHERLVVLTRLADGLHHLSHNMEASLACLLKCLGKNVIAESVNLDVHLGCSDTVCGTGYLEVHISEMVLISKNIGKDCISVIWTLCVSDKTHGHTRNRFLDLHAGIH